VQRLAETAIDSRRRRCGCRGFTRAVRW
jgi:hypothetical protein